MNVGENNTVTISVEEYRKLLEIQARADILKEYTIPQTYSVSRGSTGRKGMDKLIEHMENEGVFTAPCSTRFHLAEEGGLAEHSFNVYENALKISFK